MSSSRQRFTLDGSDALEQHLAALCNSVRVGAERLVPPRALEGLLLGGGYGRGEGGVLRTPAGDRPYNDLEFYVFIRGSSVLNERRLGYSLRAFGHVLAVSAGIEVEFKITNSSQFRLRPVTMFSYDLISGHRKLCGSDALLAGCDHHRQAKSIPSAEATRLLMNRCSGLLFSASRLASPDFGAEDADFVARNLAKAQLGFGDAVLTTYGQYGWSCLARHRSLQKLTDTDVPGLPELQQMHAAGVEFKLHPVQSTESRQALLVRHKELVEWGQRIWLWLESRRLGVRFASISDYVCSGINKCPETHPFRNCLVNLYAFGPKTLLRRDAGRYPRQRMLESLPMLMAGPDAMPAGNDLDAIQRVLRTTSASWTDLVGAYRQLWSRFN